DRALGRLFPFLDIGGRPDRVESLVKPEPRIDVAREFIGLGDDGFERRADKSVAVRLAAGQGARIAAQKRQMGGEFLTKGHKRVISLVNPKFGGVFGEAPRLLQPWKDRLLRRRIAPKRSVCGVEPSMGHLVSDD